VPIVRTFIEVREEGPHTEHLLDELQLRLANRAIVGRLAAPTIPVFYFDDGPTGEQHRETTAALTSIDEGGARQPGEWQHHLAVTGP
jgi:hypothetical protein